MAALRDLVDVWRSACADFSALAGDLDDQQWRLPTDCAGWSVGDVVAHAAALESELAGDEPLRVRIDKQATHITGPAGVYTERGVVGRRGRGRQEVVAEFDYAVERRTALLAAEPLDNPAGTPPVTPGGIGWSWGELLRNRPVDIWVHEQDVRRAIGRAGHLDSPAARHTQETFAAGLPYVVAKRAGAAPGSAVVVDVTGPVTGVYAVEVRGDGRGVPSAEPPGEPTVRLSLDTESFTVLCAGRRSAKTLPIRVVGDEELAGRVLASLTLTP